MRRTVIAIVGALLAALVAAAPASANQPPVMQPDFYRMASDRPTLTVPAPGVLANDSDPDGDPLTAALLSGTTYGTLDLRRTGRFTYTPSPGFSGLDQFSYSARDNPDDVFACCGHVYISVTRPPVAHDDDYSALSGVRRIVEAPGVLANDEWAEVARVGDPPAHGSLTLQRSGRFNYRADESFVGSDSFTYEAVVRGEPVSVGNVTMRVKASNAPPQAVSDTYTTPEDTPLSLAAPGVLANDVDPDGDPLTAEVVSYPFGEGFEFFPDGSFEYQPPIDYDSPVSFTYRVSDGLATSAPATVTIEIPAVSDPPFAEDDVFELGGSLRLDVPAPGVLANDYDTVEGDTVFAKLIDRPEHGTVELRQDGSFTYQRWVREHGVDGFSYLVSDSGGALGNIAFVTLYPNSAAR